jgi:hypothetical protein
MGFEFGQGDAKRSRRAVNCQEEDGARVIKGKRHVGSGAIPGLKSDASSDVWQQEAKQTAKKSMSLKLDWLYKISFEAKQQRKRPMMHLRFTEIPEGMAVEQDWVVIPAAVFAKMVAIEEGE